jgi:MFS family permease
MRPIDQNGLGFHELQIGALQALGGVAMMALQLFLFPWLSRMMGHRWLFRASCALWLVGVFLLPESRLWAADPADSAPVSPWTAGYWTWKMGLLWVWLTLCVMTMYSQYSLNMASVNLMVTNAANADQVGRVSGVALALAALSRTVAPLGTAVFSHSAEGEGWLWNYRFVFWVCGALGLLVLVTSFGISRNTSEGRNTRVGGSSLHKNSSVSARRSFSQGNLSESAGYSVVSASEVVKEEDE